MPIGYFILLIKLIIYIAMSFFSTNQDTVTTSSNIGMQLIENSSMEIVMPINWSNNCWGNNNAEFSFIRGGYSGDFCVKTEITEYTDGDAKWFFSPIEITPGDYLFSNYYKSDVDTRVILAITTDKGDVEYVDLPNASASEEWQTYESSFAIPEYGQSATVYHLLSQEDYLITDDYKIEPYTYVGFEQAMITITFDDGWEENYETALPIMQEYGYKSNQFYATTYIENSRIANPQEIIRLFIDDGHEIGSHSVTHPYLTQVSEEELVFELERSKAFLEDYLKVEAEYFATPYGAYNTIVNDEIMKHYSVHRTAVDFGFNSKDNIDLSRLKCMSVLSTTTTDEIAQWVKKAEEENLWLIFLYHKVVENPHKYDTTPEMFEEHMQIISDAEILVVTISEALQEIENE